MTFRLEMQINFLPNNCSGEKEPSFDRIKVGWIHPIRVVSHSVTKQLEKENNEKNASLHWKFDISKMLPQLKCQSESQKASTATVHFTYANDSR